MVAAFSLISRVAKIEDFLPEVENEEDAMLLFEEGEKPPGRVG